MCGGCGEGGEATEGVVGIGCLGGGLSGEGVAVGVVGEGDGWGGEDLVAGVCLGVGGVSAGVEVVGVGAGCEELVEGVVGVAFVSLEGVVCVGDEAGGAVGDDVGVEGGGLGGGTLENVVGCGEAAEGVDELFLGDVAVWIEVCVVVLAGVGGCLEGGCGEVWSCVGVGDVCLSGELELGAPA